MLVIRAIITYTLKAVQFLNFGKGTQLNNLERQNR